MNKKGIFTAFAFIAPGLCLGSPTLDRQFKLETIGVLRSTDNSDNFMTKEVLAAFLNYFNHQSRFVLNDLSRTDTLLSESKIPYSKLVKDSDILGRLAESTHTDSLIRTHITKAGKRYFFKIEWLHSPRMELIAEETFELEEAEDGIPIKPSDLSQAVALHLNELFAKIPFIGRVTGVDEDIVTINVGFEDGLLSKGDILTLGTLDEVKQHPLLKQIVQWKASPIARVAVEEVDQNMAFCHVVEKFPGKEILRFQKVLSIERNGKIFTQRGLASEAESNLVTGPDPTSNLSVSLAADSETPSSQTANEIDYREQDRFQLGWLSAGLISGPFSRQFSNEVTSDSGGGFALGGKVEGQIWLTHHWFLGGHLRYSFWNYSQIDQSTGLSTTASNNGGLSSSLNGINLHLAYTHLFTSSFFGPKAWAKLGYKINNFSFPVVANENTGPASLKTVFLGIGGHLPFRSGWALLANVNFRVISSITQTWLTDTPIDASDFDFYLGGDYRISSQLLIRAGVEFSSWSADYESGISLSQNAITFAPSLLYYF